MTRRQAREQAFILIFEKSFQQDCTVADIVSYAVESCFFEPDDYAVNLANSVCEHMEVLDARIHPCLKGWSAGRISRVSAALLRLAVCELLFFKEVPVSVVINEAVELSKTYASKEDASFVNGVLGTISRQGLDVETEQPSADEEEAEPDAQMSFDDCVSEEAEKSAVPSQDADAQEATPEEANQTDGEE